MTTITLGTYRPFPDPLDAAMYLAQKYQWLIDHILIKQAEMGIYYDLEIKPFMGLNEQLQLLKDRLQEQNEIIYSLTKRKEQV